MLGFKDQTLLSLGERLFSSRNLGLHPDAFVAEGVGRHFVALLKVQPEQTALLSLEFANQLRLGRPDLLDGLLADRRESFDGGGALGDIIGLELHGTLAVVALDGGLDELRSNAGVHGAVATARAADTREVRIATAALAAAESVSQAVATDAAEHRAAQIVATGLRTLLGGALLVKEDLHSVEGVLVDQRLMPSLKGLLVGLATLEDDPTGVVSITQDALDTCGVDLLRWALGTRARAQAEAVQLAAERGRRVFASGVELEGSRDEVVALGIGHSN